MEPRSTIINLIKGFIDLYGIKAEDLGFNPNRGNYIPVEYGSEYNITVPGSVFNGVRQNVAENKDLIKPTKFQNNSRVIFADTKEFKNGDLVYLCKKIV